MTNQYLEKIALNASKARAIAKQVGLIPDAASNWKWALRSLKDNKGNALQGEVLHRAKAKLGSMGTENFKKLQKTQAAHPDKELGYGVHQGKLSNRYVGSTHGVSVDSKKMRGLNGNDVGYVGHTHHLGPSVQAHTPQYMKDRPTLIASPSGLAEHAPRGDKHIKKTLRDAKYSDWLKDKLKSSDIPMHEKNEVWHKHSPKTLAIGGVGRDVQSAITHPNEINGHARIARNSISAPEMGIEGLHRSVGVRNHGTGDSHLLKHRSIFFKHE